MSNVLFGDVLYIKGRIGWQTLRKDEYLDNGDYYLVTGVDITDEHRIDFSKCYYVSKDRYDMDDKIQLQNGDIIVTKDGTIGKIAIIENLNKPATLNSHLFLIRNLRPDIIDNQYLFYILRSERFQKYALNNTSGSNIPAFTQKNISEFSIDIPLIETQQKIATTLRLIDDKIINNNAINAELEAMAKTIYDYWFLQFEFPDENGKPYKSSGGKMVYNEELKREIPEGWEVNNIASLLSFEKGKIPVSLSDNIENDKYKPYLTIAVANGEPPQYCNSKNMPICRGETIMVMDGAASGDVYVGNYGVLGSTFAMLASKRADVTDSMIYQILRSNQEIYKKANTGSTVPHANRRFIENMKLCMPHDYSVYSQTFDKIQSAIIRNNKENQELASLRDFLLPLLMNGQVGFKEEV